MKITTTDLKQVAPGTHCYNEYGEEVILNNDVTDDKGRTRFLVTPFFEGEGMTATGDGGHHHEISGGWEYEGEQRLLDAVFANPATPKLGAAAIKTGESIAVAGLALGIIKDQEINLNNEIGRLKNELKEESAKLSYVEEHILVGRENIRKLTESVNQKRQELSEIEDGMPTNLTGDHTTVATSELKRLRKRDYKLECLEAGKVNNWEWHDEALEDFYQRYPEG